MRLSALAALAAQRPMPQLLLLSALGWLALLGAEHGWYALALCRIGDGVGARWNAATLTALMYQNPPAELAQAWLVMLLAMMPPLLLHPLRHVWCRSLARRRGRAVLIFTSTYLGVWLLAGVPIVLASVLLQASLPNAAHAVWLVLVLALLWQATPMRQAALNRCHARPTLAAFGAAADRDCARYGGYVARHCVVACAGWMLLTQVNATQHLLLMAAVCGGLLLERLRAPSAAVWFAGWTRRGV